MTFPNSALQRFPEFCNYLSSHLHFLGSLARGIYPGSMIDREEATRIAAEEIARHSNTDLPYGIREIEERDFGWVFFHGPIDRSILVAGNAPLIVDRKDGSVHVTGTGYPTEHYLQSYVQLGHTRGILEPEVVLEGLSPETSKIPVLKLIHERTPKNLVESKQCIDDLVCRQMPVTLMFSTEEAAEEFYTEALKLGADARRGNRYR